MFPFVSVPHQNHCLLYSQLLCFYIFICIVHPFLRLSSLVSFPIAHWYDSVMLLLAAVCLPFLVHARTSLVFALQFCQLVSFLDIEYRTVSFLILSRLVTLNNLLNHVISAVCGSSQKTSLRAVSPQISGLLYFFQLWIQPVSLRLSCSHVHSVFLRSSLYAFTLRHSTTLLYNSL